MSTIRYILSTGPSGEKGERGKRGPKGIIQYTILLLVITYIKNKLLLFYRVLLKCVNLEVKLL